MTQKFLIKNPSESFKTAIEAASVAIEVAFSGQVWIICQVIKAEWGEDPCCFVYI